MPTDRPSRPARVRPALYRNWVTYAGGMIVVAGFVLTLMGILFQVFSKSTGPYAGIITFVLFPMPMLGGLVLVLWGMRRESVRRRRAGTTEAKPYPALDLNDPRQRRIFEILFIGGSLLLAVLAVAGYNGYEVTESPEFCGNACHKPMGPDMTAYKDSPHASVACVECHVGNGPGHYVASKVNGVKQLVGVTFDSYDRPIPPPVDVLRPARETCEACHWSKKFWGTMLYQRPLYLYDEASTADQISLLLNVGGAEQGSLTTGIHWHMVVGVEVQYVANDTLLQDIPWVRFRDRDGKTTEYFRKDRPVEPTRIPTMRLHTMDCIDCHNRPAHDYRTPDAAVDTALARGDLPRTLPWVKTESVDLLSRDFPTAQAAREAIGNDFRAFYATKYPDAAATRGEDIGRAVQTLTAIFDRNSFPEMKVNWKTYPDNIGHRNSAGCFRCHDGRHVAADGSVITQKCDACHTAPERGPMGKIGQLPATTDSAWHPWQLPQKYLDVKEHQNVLCHECHLGGRRPKTECNDCHTH